MNGPDHYREAERLIQVIEDGNAGDTMLTVAELIGMAQAHATLAQAAATALQERSLDVAAWVGVAGVPTPRCVECGTTDGAILDQQRDLKSGELVWLCYGCHTDATGGTPAEVDDEQARPAYPAPGSEIPDQPGYVVGKCGHRVAASEWRAGYRVCERCPYPDTTGARANALDSGEVSEP